LRININMRETTYKTVATKNVKRPTSVLLM
jgi:hypothetical protein